MKSDSALLADPNATLDWMRTLSAKRHGGVRVEWPDNRRAVEDALRELPESSDWPGLFDVLLEPRGPEKRVAIVLDREGPDGCGAAPVNRKIIMGSGHAMDCARLSLSCASRLYLRRT